MIGHNHRDIRIEYVSELKKRYKKEKTAIRASVVSLCANVQIIKRLGKVSVR